jgi:hypothetical protein
MLWPEPKLHLDLVGEDRDGCCQPHLEKTPCRVIVLSFYVFLWVEPTLDASLALITRLVGIVTVAVSPTWKK